MSLWNPLDMKEGDTIGVTIAPNPPDYTPDLEQNIHIGDRTATFIGYEDGKLVIRC